MLKKLSLYALIASLTLQSVQAATPVNGGEKGQPGTNVSAKDQKKQMQTAMMQKIVKMSVRDYEQMAGRKLNIGERMAFKVTKMRMKNELKKNKRGLFDNFNAGGFFLGLLLSLLGVLLAYIFSKDSNFHKWAWIGVGVSVLLSLLLLI